MMNTASERNVEIYTYAIASLSFSERCRRARNVEDRTFHNEETFTRWKRTIAIPKLVQIKKRLLLHKTDGDLFIDAFTDVDHLIAALRDDDRAGVVSIYTYSKFDAFRRDFLRIITPIPKKKLNLEREIKAILKVDSFDFLSRLIRIMAHKVALHHPQSAEISDLVMNAVEHGQVDYLWRLIDGYKDAFEHTAGGENPQYFNEGIISTLCGLLEQIQRSLERQASTRGGDTITSLRRDVSDTEMARLSDRMQKLHPAGSSSSGVDDPEMACLSRQIQQLQASSWSGASKKRRAVSGGGSSDRDSDSDSAEARGGSASGGSGLMVASLTAKRRSRRGGF